MLGSTVKLKIATSRIFCRFSVIFVEMFTVKNTGDQMIINAEKEGIQELMTTI